MSEDLNVTAVITVEDRGATAGLQKIETDVTGIDKAVARLSGTAEKSNASLSKSRSGWVMLGQAAEQYGTIAGTALIAAGGASVWATARFQKQTSALRAFSGASVADMNKMTDAATRQALANDNLGYTAGEAVQAETELAKAGVKTADIIGGGLTGTLALAATEGLAVGDAATYMSDTLNTFKLRGSEGTRVADTLAAGSASSSTSVAGLAESLSQAGLVANQTNLSLEDTVGLLSAFAQNGLKGSDAGTSLRTMLLRLNPVSTQAADLIDKYGLSAYDAQGNFIGLTAFAGKLQAGLKDLSTEQRNQVLQTVYGQDAIRAATIVYELGAKGVDEWTGAVSKSGEAQRMASEQTDNLYGDLNKLKAALDATLIKSGEGGNDALRSLTQEATTLVRGVSVLPSPILAVGAGITILSGAALIAVPRIAAMKTALAELKVTGAGAGSTLKKVGAGLGITVGITVLTQMALDGAASLAVLDENLDRVRELRDELAHPTDSTLPSQIVAEWKATGQALDETGDKYGSFLGQLNLGWQGVVAFLSGEDIEAKLVGQAGAIGDASTAGKNYQLVLLSLAQRMGTTTTAAAQILDKYASTGHAVDLLSGDTKGLAASTADWARTQQSGIDATNEATTAVNNQDAAVQRLAASLAAANGYVNQRKAIIGYQAAIDAADASLKKNGRTLDVHGEKGRANEAALLAIADAAKAAWTQTDKDGVVTVTNSKRYRQATREIVSQATAMGKSKAEAQALAKKMMGVNSELDKTGKKKPKAKTTLDQTDGRTGTKIDIIDKIGLIEQKLAGLDGQGATVTVTVKTNGPTSGPFAGLTGDADQDPNAAFGDTSYSRARGGRLGRTLSAHGRHTAGLSGMRVSNLLMGGGGAGFGSGDHQAGRAIDVVGPHLGEYIRRVREAGGFAEIHGTGPGRHAHSVPAGDTTTSRAGGGAGPALTQITVPLTVVGKVTADQVEGLRGALAREVERWQRQLIERGTG